MQQFPGLSQLGQGAQQQAPNALQAYQFPGIQFAPGQGQQGFGNLSPFEGAKGFGSESITAGLALGNYGKSSSQTPPGAAAQPFNLGQLSLPSFALPQAVAAQQGGYGDGLGEAGATGEGAEGAGGVTIGASDVLGAGQEALNLLAGPSLGQQTTTPGFAEQRAGERTDYSNATGSPSGIPQLAAPNIIPPSQQGVGFGQGAIPSLTDIFGGISGGPPTIGAPGLNPGSVGQGVMPGIGDVLGGVNAGDVTMAAPGGSAQFSLGGAPTGGLLSSLGNATSTALTGAAGIGGVAQIVAGVQGLTGGDSQQYSGALLQLAQGGVQTYQTLQQLSQQFPQISEAIMGGALPSISEGLLQLTQGVGGQTAANLVTQIDNFVNGTAGAAGATAGGLSSGLSIGGAGAGAVAAILGIIAQQTGSKELGIAAQALGVAASAAATTAAVTAAITGAVTGVVSAAGAAFAPIAAFMIVSTISGLLGGEDPIGEGIGEMMRGGAHYQTFVPELMQNVGQQDTSFSTLGQALPYVQSQEELGQLINSYKNYLQNTTGITLEETQGDPYHIASIPGVGPSTHGVATQPVDFGDQQRALQQQIDALMGVLPGQRITAQYGQPGGGLEGEPAMRLWTQFLDRGQNAPIYEKGTTENQIGAFNLSPGEIVKQGFYGIPQSADALRYGQEGYDYAGSGFPMPGQYIGAVSPYWPQAQQNIFASSPQGQYSQQFMQQLQQFVAQLQGLQGGLGQVSQGLQQQPAQGMDPALLAQMQQAAPGFGGGMNSGGNASIDLQALLRQLGLAA